MYDVLLISPHIDYYDSGKPFRTSVNIERSVPLGITGITQFLHDSGFSVRLLHLPSFDFENLETLLAGFPARLVLIQCHWFLYGSGAVKSARVYKDLFPDSVVYLGGYHANYFALEILENAQYIDGIIIGEGEIPALRLTRGLSKGKKSLFSVSATIYRSSSGEICTNPPEDDDLPDIEKSPIIYPAAEIYENLDFFHDRYGSTAMSIERGRCNFRCRYCVSGTGFYARENSVVPVERAIEQLRVFEEYGARNIFIGEFSFLHREYFKDLCGAIMDNNISLNIILETSPLLFEDDEVVAYLDRANIREFSLGIESGINPVLKRLNRGVTAEIIRNSVQKIASIKGIAFTSWLANIPGTSRTEHESNLVFLETLVREGAIATWINNLLILPGTEYFDRYRSYNINVLTKSFIDWCRFSLAAKTIVSKEMLEKTPEKYFTYEDTTIGFKEMITRLFEMKDLASNTIGIMDKTIEDSFIPDFQKNNLLEALHQYNSINKNLVQM
ncbi:MAG: radical SAM protein [bacterium]|nr:radical SAM protein [bacterium]